METLQRESVDRERLEFVTRTAGNYQGLGVSVSGLLVALYGATNLLSHQPSGFGQFPLFLVVLCAIFVIPRIVAHFYYRRKFGYVKPTSPNPSWKVVWLSTGAFALFLYLTFTVSDYVHLHQPAFGFEPLTFFLGIVFLIIALSGLGRPHYYKPYELLIEAFALFVVAFLPVLHLQTKEQVFNGWLWVIFGTVLVVTGLRTHRVLVRNLTPNESRHDHA